VHLAAERLSLPLKGEGQGGGAVQP
jgi:hypothetical protein